MSGSLRVLHAPVSPDNPYQLLLFRALAAAGVSVTTLSFQDLNRPFALSRKGRFDLVHLHWPHGFYQVTGRMAAPRTLCRAALFAAEFRRMRRRIPVVWTMHNRVAHQAPLPALDHRLSLMIARGADRVVAHCAAARQLLVEEWGVAAERVLVIPHGSFIGYYPDTLDRAAARSRLGLPADARVLLFFGLLRENKGLRELLAAFHELTDPRCRLVVAGGGAGGGAGPELASAIQEAAAADPRLRPFPRRVTDEEVEVMFKAADAVVLPYQEVLTSSVLALALDFGRAVVAPRRGCLPEQMAEGGGALYDPAAPDGLLAALRQALAADTEAMGAKNLALARERSWDRLVPDLIRAYEEAMARSPR
jgi:glycosyltransferase involved in cell wall biosynthesis